MGPQSALDTKQPNGILACIDWVKYCQQVEGGDSSLSSSLVKPHLEHCVQYWPHSTRET